MGRNLDWCYRLLKCWEVTGPLPPSQQALDSPCVERLTSITTSTLVSKEKTSVSSSLCLRKFLLRQSCLRTDVSQGDLMLEEWKTGWRRKRLDWDIQVESLCWSIYWSCFTDVWKYFHSFLLFSFVVLCLLLLWNTVSAYYSQDLFIMFLLRAIFHMWLLTLSAVWLWTSSNHAYINEWCFCLFSLNAVIWGLPEKLKSYWTF